MYEVLVWIPGVVGVFAVAARGIMEGPKREVILLGWRSNME